MAMTLWVSLSLVFMGLPVQSGPNQRADGDPLIAGSTLLAGAELTIPSLNQSFEFPLLQELGASNPGDEPPLLDEEGLLEHGDDFYSEPRPHFPKFLFQKTREIFSSPLHAGRGDWLETGLVAVGIHLVGRMDGQVTDWVRESGTTGTSRFLNEVGPFGEEYAFLTIGGFYLSGLVFKSDRAKLVARDSLAASIIAAGMITPAAKSVFGRERPRDGNNPNDYNFFGGGTSFPSGHTTQAFAVAGTIAAHYDQPWVKVTSYGIATLVGISRIDTDAHYLSDVAAGALVGIWVSRRVTGHSGSMRGVRWTPYLASNGIGVSIKFKNGMFK